MIADDKGGSMLRFRTKNALAAVMAGGVSVLALAAQSHAATIGISNTGTTAAGTVDPNWQVVSSPDPNYPGPSVYVSSSLPGDYYPDNSTSKWISMNANANSTMAPGVYEYQTTFSLAGLNPSTAVLEGQWASDNESTIYINGVPTSNTIGAYEYGVLTSFTISSGFDPGVNTLDFYVTNDNDATQGQTNPSALRVIVSGTAAAAVPEPVSLGMCGVGGLMLLVGRRRSKLRA
jgi:hypothetical protein